MAGNLAKEVKRASPRSDDGPQVIALGTPRHELQNARRVKTGSLIERTRT
jgi:hypothetical protein